MSMSISSRCVNKSMDCSLSTGLTVLTWSASTFSSASLSWSKRSTGTGTHLLTSLPIVTLVLSQSNKTLLSFSWALEPDGCSAKTRLPVLTIGFLVVGWVCWKSSLPPLLNPILSSNCLQRKSSEVVEEMQKLMISPVLIMIAFGNDCVRSCLTEHLNLFYWASLMSPQWTVFWCFSMLYACIVQDAVHSSRSYQDFLLFVCCSNFLLLTSILNSQWSWNWLHIRRVKCTRRNRLELIHCPAVLDQWDSVLNDLQELGDQEFLVLMDQYNIEVFFVFSVICHCTLPHFIRPMLRSHNIVPKIIPWSM